MNASDLTIQWILNALSVYEKIKSIMSNFKGRVFALLALSISLISCGESEFHLTGGDILNIAFPDKEYPLDKVYKDKILHGEWESLYIPGKPTYVGAASKVMLFKDLALVHIYNAPNIKIIAFDKRTGEIKWENPLPPSKCRPSYIERKDNLIVCVDESAIVCFDIIERSIKWQYSFENNHNSAEIHPLLIDDRLYCGQIDDNGHNKMVSFDLYTGSQEIVFTESTKWKSNEFSKPSIVTNGDKYLIFKSRYCMGNCDKTNEDLRVYNLTKKSMHWEIDKLNNASTSFDNIIYNDNNSIYTVGNRDLFQIDVIDKEIKNKIPVFDPNLKYNSISDAHVDPDNKVMYIHTIESVLLAVNIEDMTIKWKNSNIKDYRCMDEAPCIINNKLVINDHSVKVLDKNTGQPIHSEYVWKENSLDGNIVYDPETDLLFGNDSQSITAFRYTK